MYERKFFEGSVAQKVCGVIVAIVLLISIGKLIYIHFPNTYHNSPENVIRMGTEKIREEYVAMYESGSLLHTVPEDDAKILEAYGLTFIHTVDLLNRTYEGSNGWFMYVIDLENDTCEVVKNNDGTDMTVNQWLDKMIAIWNS